MRPRFAPRPDRSELLGLELHEIVRDYPETLSVLRRHGVNLRERGARALAESGGADGGGASPSEALVDDLLDALSWRRRR